MIKALLIDDEKTVLSQMQYVLAQYSEIEIKGAYTDPLEALQNLLLHNPDVVFLDIEMPDVNGFIVAEEIQKLLDTAIVFVTGFDDFALKAFEFNAVDYLLKPVSKKRMDATIIRIAKNIHKKSGKDQKENTLVDKLARRNLEKIFVWEDEKISILKPAEVLLFTFQGRDVKVITKRREYRTKQTLNYWEERLVDLNFFRCHRSYLVNIDKIAEILPMFNYTYLLKLADYPREIPVSRSKANELKQILGL